MDNEKKKTNTYKVKGSTTFQQKCIRISKRKRGKEERTQIYKKQKTKKDISKIKKPKYKDETIERNTIKEYSHKKIKTKFSEKYSTLNPDTSSDSPSTKSKGERPVSAKQVKNQQKKRGILMKKEKKPFNK